ncbi:MAG: hypothetical protein JNM09_00950 [Blastocatellia bacterium]|nr:hypothetical protein [Blastocatellia bacterium]
MKQQGKLTILISLLLLLTVSGWAQKSKPKKAEVDLLAIPSLKINGPAEIKTCTGEGKRFALIGVFANLDTPEATVWTINGKQVGKGSHYTLDTASFAPGSYKLTAELIEGKCVAYDNRIIVVNECTPPKPVVTCYDEKLTVEAAQAEVDGGETVRITRSQVNGGQNYGQTSVAWFASAGTIRSSNDQAMLLDTTGVAPEATITVRVEVTSTEACKAEGATSVKIKAVSPPPVPVVVATCDTFKQSNARVDNACKNLLMDVARQLQAQPTAKLLIIGEQLPTEKARLDLTRASNVKAALTQGAIGITIDANRIEVKTQPGRTKQARVILIP